MPPFNVTVKISDSYCSDNVTQPAFARGEWSSWRACPRSMFATAIKVRVNILRILSPNFYYVGNQKMFDARQYGTSKEQQTGLTDLILVCEDGTELSSYSDLISVNPVGHIYQSDEAVCTGYWPNFIRGIRMKYDKTKHPAFDDTMIHNIAIACTRDYAEEVRKEYALKALDLQISGGDRLSQRF